MCTSFSLSGNIHSFVCRGPEDPVEDAKGAVEPTLPSETDSSQVLEVAPDVNGMHIEEHRLTLRDLFVKDAFLIFRALCKKSREPLSVERCAFSTPGYLVVHHVL